VGKCGGQGARGNGGTKRKRNVFPKTGEDMAEGRRIRYKEEKELIKWER